MTATEEVEWTKIEDGPLMQRDRFGRPLVIPPDGGRPTPYTRCTTYVNALEDTYNLGMWQQRMVAAGLSIRPDLLLRVNSLGQEPAKFVGDNRGGWVANPKFAPWREEMDTTCEAAKEAAQAHAKATVGTSLHALAERMDKGEDVGVVPEAYLPHLAAYAEATDRWEYLHIERFMINDELKVGGTPDRVAYVPGYDAPMITDIKTGDVTYGVGKMAMQLAIYAHCRLYDLDGARHDLPDDLDHQIGLIVALDATRGTCEVFEIDIALGWEAVSLAGKVRAWRGRRGLMKPWHSPQRRPDPSESYPWRGKPELTEAESLELSKALARAESIIVLEAIWRTVEASAWTDYHTQVAGQRKAELIKEAAA